MSHLVGDAVTECLAEGLGAVAGPVVGEHPVDVLDTLGGEQLGGAFPEPCRGHTFLVRKLFGVAMSGAVIHS